MAIRRKDLGIDRGSVKQFDPSKPENKLFFSFTKLFHKMLKEFNISFYDPCCSEASGDDKYPVAFDLSQGQLVRYNPATKTWVALTSFTTTTTTSSTTTTTTVP
jgi:hypothetical protein